MTTIEKLVEARKLHLASIQKAAELFDNKCWEEYESQKVTIAFIEVIISRLEGDMAVL